jgi:hypothetical protein
MSFQHTLSSHESEKSAHSGRVWRKINFACKHWTLEMRCEWSNFFIFRQANPGTLSVEISPWNTFGKITIDRDRWDHSVDCGAMFSNHVLKKYRIVVKINSLFPNSNRFYIDISNVPDISAKLSYKMSHVRSNEL